MLSQTAFARLGLMLSMRYLVILVVYEVAMYRAKKKTATMDLTERTV